MKTIQDKKYYTITEVAAMLNVNASKIRFWETEFDILKPKKNKKGDRFFDEVNIENLQLIYYLLKIRRFTIEGAKRKIKDDIKGIREEQAMRESLLKMKSFLEELEEAL
jgi:DNA-binding transcriptional MerR regulator